MKHILFAFLLPLTVLCAAEVPAKKPNIILIYSDDHGWADLGAQGVDKDIRTPNLDRLAQDGVRFSRGYVTAPQCVPSRAGVITGRYQQRFGVEDNNKGPLPLAELTIAERLKPAGYTSCQIGKWHLEPPPPGKGGGDARGFEPWAQGFEEYYTGQMNSFAASHDVQGRKLPDAPKQLADKRFRCVWQADAAISFIDRHPGDPFFLYLAFFAPHVPLESPEPWFSQTHAHLPKERRQALAMIAAMDDGVGRIRAKLQAAGIEQNTLIFFIGDNGAPLKQGAWDGSLNLPLIGEKGMLTDGGIRTPFVAAWPGTLPSGKVYEQPVSSLDVAATAVALAGLPPDKKLDGVNLIPFLCGKDDTAPHESLFWRWRSQAAVLEFPWKLIRLGPNERYLFDVTTPAGETRNLIARHPDIAARLDAKLKTWSDTLQPPGLPTEIIGADRSFFEDHGLLPGKAIATGPIPSKTETAPVGTVQGWICRNGSLALQDGALVIRPAARNAASNVGAFVTCNTLDIPGPVTATLRVRAKSGDHGSFTWRSKGQADFSSENRADFDWPATMNWQDVKVELPVTGSLIHLRIHPGKDAVGPEIQSIELRGKDGNPIHWRFDSARGG